MAVEAGLVGGNVGVAGYFSERVTVPTIQAQLARVDFVGKRHRLGGLVADAGVFGCKIIWHGETHPKNDEASRHGQLQGEPVGPTRKEIAHKKSQSQSL